MNETALELQLFENLKPGLTSFCYRMLGSIADADDAVQETYIRVWKSWNSFKQESSYKTWFYRIATNICRDKLRQAKRRALPVDLSDSAASIIEPREVLPDSSWIWPAPDFAETPEDIFIRKDTLQLCFIALLQTLPLRQRAVFILKDVFEWSSKEIADSLGISPAAVNSTLQRARETLDRVKLRSNEFNMMDVEPDREMLSRYVEAFEQFDIHALVSLFHEEGCMSMPPFVMWVRGKDDLFKFFFAYTWALFRVSVFADYGEWRLSCLCPVRAE
ncbi:RNA polymerase subunit sigma-70 [Cohnella kolymensis]|uniref:RNA polymerase subunit sigma-70 n=1 Tax=Cohnella kolymensis TaxID=1590652 RepID=UPI000A9F311A|nr:RNA polymerase subunit sigma-70 [Cohnella kolymensis]